MRSQRAPLKALEADKEAGTHLLDNTKLKGNLTAQTRDMAWGSLTEKIIKMILSLKVKGSTPFEIFISLFDFEKND